MSDTPPVLTARGLAIGFPGTGRAVAEALDIDLPAGGFVAVVGPSGVGKSTLLRVLGGLMPPLAGTVRWTGDARRPALVFQDGRLLPWRRVLGNVAFALEGLGMGRKAREDRARAMLEIVRLTELADRWPHQLSGGQRQRVGIARALAAGGNVLLMDEPFGALDALTRTAMHAELRRIQAETGVAVLLVTHDLDEAVALAERVLVLGGSPARVTLDMQVDRAAVAAGAEKAQVERLRRAIGADLVDGDGI